jgi:hypothetical protein
MDQHTSVAASSSAQVAASQQILAALAGLCTAGPLGALASLAAIRGLHGKWSTWFLLGVPAAITINGLYVGLFFGFVAIVRQAAPQPQAGRSLPPAEPQPTPTVAPSARTTAPEPITQAAEADRFEFVYFLGAERIAATADCTAGTWITRPDLISHRPQSAATENMLKRVCQVRAGRAVEPSAVVTAFVFDPPSNIRAAPNGAILCSVSTKQSITVWQREGDWIQTNYCGSIGYIHVDQIRF